MTLPPLKKILLPLLLIGAGVGVAAALVVTKPEAKSVEVEEKAWLVGATEVKRITASPSLELFGRVESLQESTLTAPMEADVLEVPIIEGDAMVAGTLLVALDDRDATLLLAQREADLAEINARMDSERNRKASDEAALPHEEKLLRLARTSVKRANDLQKKKLGSQSTLDDARKEVERQALSVTARKQSLRDHAARMAELKARQMRAIALRDQAKLEIERTQVRAPYNGFVLHVPVSVGQRVRKGDVLVEVYSSDDLVLRAQIPDRYVAPAQQAMGRGDALVVEGRLDGQPIRAELLRMSAEVGRGSGGVEGLFKISASNEDQLISLQKGRFLKLDLALPAQDKLIALPNEALYGVDRIYLMQDERMKGLTVERVGESLGEDGEALILIRSDQLQDGDRIITTQLPNAVEGLLVRVAAE